MRKVEIKMLGKSMMRPVAMVCVQSSGEVLFTGRVPPSMVICIDRPNREGLVVSVHRNGFRSINNFVFKGGCRLNMHPEHSWLCKLFDVMVALAFVVAIFLLLGR